MSPAVICLCVFLFMTFMILMGVPLPLSMMIATFVGLTSSSGITATLMQFRTAFYTLSHSYNFAVIPLFMMFGTLASISGLGEDCFKCMKKWLGGLRGGLLYTVVIANMIFGACSGVSAAGNMVFSKIAMPELRREHYDESVSIGTITASGSLSVLIPPSVPIISFCLLAGASIGAALVTGISAGILFALLMMLIIFIIGKIKPEKIPAVSEEYKHVPLTEKLKTLRLLIPIVLLFALIVGGSFLGWFTSTVGGAVAVVVILLYCFMKKVPLKTIFHGLWDGASSFGGMFLVIICGQTFSRFVTASGVTQAISDLIARLNMPPMAVFAVVFVFYLFCGCFMDCLSIIVITVPVIFPILTGLGFNEIILVMLLVFSMEIAGLTPPVGLSVFYVSSINRIKTTTVFKGVMPYFIMDVVFVFIIALLPETIMWLPHLLGY